MKQKLLELMHATTKKNKLPLRILLATLGVLTMGFGMSVLEKLNFGTDPFTCMNNGISMVSGLSIGTVALLISAILFVVVICTDLASIGIGTLLNMVGFGYSIDLFRILWAHIGFTAMPDGVLRYGLLVGMLFVFILAVSLYLAADLGSAPYDAMPVYIAKKSGVRFVFVRMAWDLCAVLIGFLLGSAVGVTTLVCALLVGPAAAIVKKGVDKLLTDV